ncbi:Fur family transcriptional regulator [Tessaracoccus antarcticus]|uniref:Transcriptional repressor n=1 Tax=Tessaracoccus antarcticus TaxID=2479848 RepID=A0A3M0GIP4_9ACTN|nr:Fur family transcriptional regulator [Tessaracoccus antarcticus]RMB61483.1 transcriptional repressor [Tessaracoccus antarcticus]
MSVSPVASPHPSVTASAEAVMRARGIRVTASRVAVLSAVGERPHTDADTLTRMIRDRLGAVSTQAVYDALALFTSLGLVRRIVPAGSSARYETRVGDNHHHLACRRCGALQDVDCATGTSPCLTPVQAHGFLVDEAEVTYWGLCPACQQDPA